MTDTAYTIRPFPRKLHRKAKAIAALEGITLKELILDALSEYVEKKEKHIKVTKPTLEELLQRSAMPQQEGWLNGASMRVTT